MDIKDLQPLAMVIIFVGIIIAVGVLMLDTMSDDFRDTGPSTHQNFTMESNTTFTFAQDELITLTIYNTSDLTQTVEAANYTADLAAIAIVGISGAGWNTSPATAIYTYYYEGWATNGSEAGVSALAEQSSWLDLIAIIFIAVIIIGLIFKFGIGRKIR